MNKLKLCWQYCLIFFLSILLFACSKISQENFNKIKPQMEMEAVIAILGKPTSAESVTIAGMSGTSAIWKDKDAEIDIQFLNNKVLVKSFSLDSVKQPTTEKTGPE